MRAAAFFGPFGLLLATPALGGGAGLAAAVACVAWLLALAAQRPQGVAPAPRAVLGVALALGVALGGAWCLAQNPLGGFFWLLGCCYLLVAAWFLLLFAKGSRWTP